MTQLLGQTVNNQGVTLNTLTAAYTYDAGGRRIAKSVSYPSDPAASFTEAAVYDGSTPILMFDGGGKWIAINECSHSRSAQYEPSSHSLPEVIVENNNEAILV